MPRKSPAAIPFEKFMGKYASDIAKARVAEKGSPAKSLSLAALMRGDFEPPGLTTSTMLWGQVEQWWPVLLLRTAARANDVEGYKRLLHYFLVRLGVEPPESVLTPFRWKRGRPDETEMIYAAWIAKGRPSLQWRVLDELAKTFYPDTFAEAASDLQLRKNLRDRVRGTILRHEAAAPATKSAPIS